MLDLFMLFEVGIRLRRKMALVTFILLYFSQTNTTIIIQILVHALLVLVQVGDVVGREAALVARELDALVLRGDVALQGLLQGG